MFISFISVDNWNENIDIGEEIEEFSWETIENAIKALNGDTKTQVSLNAEEEIHMCIGGGNNGLYNVYATFDNMRFYNLKDSDKSDTEMVELVTGGQLGEFPANICVTLDKVLKAANTFAEHGKIDETLEWDYVE